MSDETTLLSCPFCGGEAEVCEGGINGKMRVYGLVEHKDGCFFLADGLPTKYQHIMESEFGAWNTRASDHHPYEQRITGDGSDWGEIMRDAYDSLMATACESCTPEQMGQLADYIRAELGSGTCELVETEVYIAREEVHVLECSACGETCEHVNGSYPRCPHCGRHCVHHG